MSDDDGPFGGTEEYYAKHRPGYGDAALSYLRERFDLDGDTRVLDLGCGAGQIAVPLAAHVGEAVGMDPNEAMLRQAERRAEAAGRENLTWVIGSDADLSGELGGFGLATMGRSFHWMDERETLERLRGLLEPGGGVAILDDEEWFTRGTEGWQDAVYDLAAEYLDELPERTGPVDHSAEDPWDELVESVGFDDVEAATFAVEREWTVDAVVGYAFSLSYCSPDRFGEEKAAFESALRERLAQRPEETFPQRTEVTVISGRR
ncbi:class I SAM-dependent methyltransferase [Halostella litorea]|uniref:class I SAM-dependent methyltransferase n=1 Tax=Halostella litorea TaxID=2528831 RepID=UPI001F40B27F|nr:class I SAM-dependent methyltransferase [Halostella litorea]